MENQLDFFNTTEIGGAELCDAIAKVKGQNADVLSVFQRSPNEYLTPWEVKNRLGDGILITSVRRSITVLTEKKLLCKSNVKKPGPFGPKSFAWKLSRL